MKRRVFLMVLMTAIALSVWAENEWVENEEDIKIPEGYEKAWETYIDNDEIFYKMMQLGRGVSKGDKIAFYATVHFYLGLIVPVQQSDNSWAIVFYTLENFKGSIIVLFPEIPIEMKIDATQKGFLFARYEGAGIGEVPILIGDQLSLEKDVFSSQSFEYGKDINIETVA